MDYRKKIERIIKEQNGTVLSSDLEKYDIPRTYLRLMVKEDSLEKIGRGVYVGKGHMHDEMYAMQKKYPNIIYSHETALYLHDLSDRNPYRYSVSVPSGYKAVGDIAKKHKVYYIRKEMFNLGRTTMKSPLGNALHVYDVERTICDIIRSRHRMDIQVFTEALKRYAKKQTADHALLMEYANKLGIASAVSHYMEILL